MSLKVSIITPAYNATETIAETLESILGQTSPDWESIVVDDGSTDDTAVIVQNFMKRDGRIRLIQQSNAGEAAARNSGIRAATQDWLLFLDADDWIAPSYLERVFAELTANSQLDAVHCSSARVTKDGTIIPETRMAPVGDLFPTLARYNEFPVHACVIRKSLVDAVGGFDSSLKTCPDWDLWQRIARKGAHFGAVRDVLAFYRMRSDAASMDASQMLKDGLRVLRQGHRSDPRVSNPLPAHANGLPSERMILDEYYLTAWYAGVLLGQKKDARPLLDLIPEKPCHELSPESIAEGIFEMAPIANSQPPQFWENLMDVIEPQIDDFLTALEQRSTAPNLATRTMSKLKTMMQPVLPELPRSKSHLSKTLFILISVLVLLIALETYLRLTWRPQHSLMKTAQVNSMGWWLHTASKGTADLVFQDESPEAARIIIHEAKTSNPFDVQLNLSNLEASSGQRYRLQFRAKADKTRNVLVGFSRSHHPWDALGLYEKIQLSENWQDFQRDFSITSDDKNARIHFDAGENNIPIEVSSVSLINLEEGTSVFPRSACVEKNPEAQNGPQRILFLGEMNPNMLDASLTQFLQPYQIIECVGKNYPAEHRADFVFFALTADDAAGKARPAPDKLESFYYTWAWIQDYRHSGTLPNLSGSAQEILRLDRQVKKNGTRLGVILLRNDLDYAGVTYEGRIWNHLTRTMIKELRNSNIPIIDLGRAPYEKRTKQDTARDILSFVERAKL